MEDSFWQRGPRTKTTSTTQRPAARPKQVKGDCAREQPWEGVYEAGREDGRRRWQRPLAESPARSEANGLASQEECRKVVGRWISFWWTK